MRPNIAPQTESNYGRRPVNAQMTSVAFVAITLAATSLPDYRNQWYGRVHLKPVTDSSSANTAPVATKFADATSDYARQITARLMDLRAAAHECQMPWSRDSADALQSFLSFFPKPNRPIIVLTDTGNLAAVWESGRDSQIALQFLGHDIVQYTLLARPPGEQVRSSSNGRATPARIVKIISDMDLLDLLTA